MKSNKITIMLASFALIAMMVTPVLADFPEDYTSNLYAGRKLVDVGDVIVQRTTNNLYITYRVNEGCYLLETHLDVVTDATQFPMTKSGNPKVGHFEYATDPHDPMTTQVTYTVDVSGTSAFATFYIAAHAVVSCGGKTETAWGDTVGDPASMMYFPGNSWAFYFQFPPVN